MLTRDKIVSMVLITAVLTSYIFFAIATRFNYYEISSKGVIIPLSFHPSGKLHIGNEANGEKTWFFYDENGKLVTLRMMQSGHRGIGWYTEMLTTGDFAGDTWANASIKFAKDAEFNCFSIHMFWGNKYISSGEWLYPSRRTVNETIMNYFTDHLKVLADNDIYFMLDGYDNNDDWWLAQEMMGNDTSKGGLMWNETVRSDFVWMWNVTLDAIKNKGQDVWNHLVLFDPWRESLTDFNSANSLRSKWRDPYRYNQSDWYDGGRGNASLVSWQNWLKRKYDDNMTELKRVWCLGYQPEEAWNASGRETDNWNSLLMPTKSIRNSYNRGYDFGCWYAEAIENFTRDCNSAWKASFSDLYVAWGGWKPFVSWGSSVVPSDIDVRTASCFKYSDVLYGDLFASPNEGEGYAFGDDGATEDEVAMVAKALKKPYFIGEFGATVNSGVGYDSAQDANNIGYWNVTLSKCLRQGYAGWLPYWISYWHSFETGLLNRVTRCDVRRPYMKQLNLLYKAAENWLDKIEYAPICISKSVGSHYLGEDPLGLLLFAEAGYNIKYARCAYDNETVYPSSIPSDAEILIVSGFGHTNGRFSKKELKQASDWLDADSSHKIILCWPCAGDILRDETFYFEDYFNTSLFPLAPVTYGDTYASVANSTDVHVNVDGTSVLLKRSNYFHSGFYLNFSMSAITGKCLINYTDGDYPNQPMTIINDRVCWVGAPIGRQCGNPEGTNYAKCKNGYLILREILSYWGYKPKADITKSYWRVGYVFNKLSSAYAIQGFYSLNHTDSGTITPKFNFTRMGLNRNCSYIVFSTTSKNAVSKTPAELENGISISLGALNRENLVLRSNDSLCYLYSNSYITNEMLTSPQSLTCIFTGVINQTDTVYFYFPYDNSSEWKIKFSNGTTLNAEDYFDSTNKLIKIPFKLQNLTTAISIYKISASS